MCAIVASHRVAHRRRALTCRVMCSSGCPSSNSVGVCFVVPRLSSVFATKSELGSSCVEASVGKSGCLSFGSRAGGSVGNVGAVGCLCG